MDVRRSAIVYKEVLIILGLDLGTITFPEFIRAITSWVEKEVDLTIAGKGVYS